MTKTRTVDADGFTEVSFTGKMRRNSKWLQLKTVINGKERYFLMQEVPSLRAVAKDKGLPFSKEK